MMGMSKDDVHCMPVNDLIEHTYVDCPCVPEVIPVEREDGSVGWVMAHHSLDGRELRERGLEVPKE